MLWQDRGPSYDLGVALGLLLAVLVCAPAYLIVAAVRRVAGFAGDALAPVPRMRAPARLLRFRASGA